MVHAITAGKTHVIATMRAKTEYVVDKDEKTGKSAPRKVGLAPVFRSGGEYEFDLVANMDLDANSYIVGVGTSTDRKEAYFDSNMNIRGIVGFNTTNVLNGSLLASAVGTGAEANIILRWDEDAGNIPENATYTATGNVDAEAQVSATTTGTALSSDVEIVIGRFRTAGNPFAGLIQSIEIYGTPGADPSP